MCTWAQTLFYQSGKLMHHLQNACKYYCYFYHCCFFLLESGGGGIFFFFFYFLLISKPLFHESHFALPFWFCNDSDEWSTDLYHIPDPIAFCLHYQHPDWYFVYSWQSIFWWGTGLGLEKHLSDRQIKWFFKKTYR